MAADTREDIDLRTVKESDRHELENLLEQCATIMENLRNLTKEYKELPAQSQQTWLEKNQKRNEFEMLRQQIDDSGRRIDDLTMSMKRLEPKQCMSLLLA